MLKLKPLRERRRDRLKEIDGLFGNNYSLFKVKSNNPAAVDFDASSPIFRKPRAPQKDLYFPDGTKVPTMKDVPKLPTAREVKARLNQVPIRPKSMFRMYCSAPAFKRVQKPSQPSPLLLKNRLQNLHGETSKYFMPEHLQQRQPLNELAKKIQSKATNAETSKSIKLKAAQSPWVNRALSQLFDQSEDVGSWSVHKLLDKHVPCPDGAEDFRGQNVSYEDDDKDTSYRDFENEKFEVPQGFNWTMSDNSADEDTRSGSSKFVTRPQSFHREEPKGAFGCFDRNDGTFDRNNCSSGRNNGSTDRNNGSLGRSNGSSGRSKGSLGRSNGSFDRNQVSLDRIKGSLDRNNVNVDRNNTRLDLPTLPEYFDGIGTFQNGNISSTILASNTSDSHHCNKQSSTLRPKKGLGPTDDTFHLKAESSNSGSSDYSRTGCLCSSCKSSSSATTPPPFTVRELIHMNKQNEESSSNASDHSSNFNPFKSTTSGIRSSKVNNDWANHGDNNWTNSGGNKSANNGEDTWTNRGGNQWANNGGNQWANNGDHNNNDITKTEYQPAGNPVRNLFKRSSTVTSSEEGYVYNFPPLANGGFGNNPNLPHYGNDLKPSTPGTTDLFSYNSNTINLPPPREHFSYHQDNNKPPPSPSTPPDLIIYDPYGRVCSPDEKTKTDSGLEGISSSTSTMSSTHWPADDPMRAFGTQAFNYLEDNPFKQFEDDDAVSKRTVDTNLSFSPSGSLNNHSYDFEENNGGGWEFDDADDDLFGNM